MPEGLGKHADSTLGYIGIAIAAIVSALGLFGIEKIVVADTENGRFVIAFMKTLFSLLPAAAAFWIAHWRQRKTHKNISMQLARLKKGLDELERIRRIEHELHTMERLAKVAREVGKNTASSAKELLGVIEGIDDPWAKERLTQRYRYLTNNVITVLSAVGEQMEDSGKSIQRELTADESIHVLEREKSNITLGIQHAKEMMEQRGIIDGLKQLTFASEQAAALQNQLATLKSLTAPEAKNDQD